MYKRQEYEEGKAESDQEIADAKKELEQARKDLNAVSYTHLDVYKRQMLSCKLKRHKNKAKKVNFQRVDS